MGFWKDWYKTMIYERPKEVQERVETISSIMADHHAQLAMIGATQLSLRIDREIRENNVKTRKEKLRKLKSPKSIWIRKRA